MESGRWRLLQAEEMAGIMGDGRGKHESIGTEYYLFEVTFITLALLLLPYVYNAIY